MPGEYGAQGPSLLSYEDFAASLDLLGLCAYDNLANIVKFFRHIIEVAHAAAIYGGIVCSGSPSDVVDLLSQSQGDNEEAEMARKKGALTTARELFSGTLEPLVSEGEGEDEGSLTQESLECTIWLLPTLLAMTAASADQVDNVFDLLVDLKSAWEQEKRRNGLDRVFVSLFAVSLLHAHSALGQIRSDSGTAGKPMTEKSLCRRFAVKIGAYFTPNHKDWLRAEVQRIFALQGIPKYVARELHGVVANVSAGTLI